MKMVQFVAYFIEILVKSYCSLLAMNECWDEMCYNFRVLKLDYFAK